MSPGPTARSRRIARSRAWARQLMLPASHYTSVGWYVEGRRFSLTAKGLDWAVAFAVSLVADYARPVALQVCREPGNALDRWTFHPECDQEAPWRPRSSDLAELVAEVGG